MAVLKICMYCTERKGTRSQLCEREWERGAAWKIEESGTPAEMMINGMHARK